MSALIKPLAAFAVSLLVFAGFIFLADFELLDLIQTRFYNPSVVNSYVKENDIDADIAQKHINDLYEKFAETLAEHAVRSSFLYSQSADDIFQRSKIYGTLLESTGALQSVQFVDTNGLRIHFSTSPRDIYSQSRASTTYRNYNEDASALPYDAVSVPDGGSPKFVMDEKSERIVFSFPFYDSMDVYRGTALFNVGARAIAEKLISEGRLKVSDNVSVVADPSGILLGSPEVSKADIVRVVAQVWKDGIQQRVTLDSGGSGANYSLITVKTNQVKYGGIFFGRLVNDHLFAISEPMKLILNLSIFLTFFLTFFFLINLKPNPPAVVRNRLKRLRESLFEQLYVNKSAQERAGWILELEQRRDEIRKELKHNLRLSGRQEKIIDGIINNSWDELLAVIKVGSGVAIGGIFVQPSVVDAKKGANADIEEIEEAEAVDEIEEVDGIEEVEEAEEAESIDDIEEIEELGEINVIDKALRDAIVPVQPYSVGLLKLATDFLSGKTAQLGRGKGLLKKASEKKSSAEKGPLSKDSTVTAESGTDKPVKSGKGLLALASKIGFRHDYPVDDEVQDLIVDIDIVSPFSSMFSSLDDFSDDDFPRT